MSAVVSTPRTGTRPRIRLAACALVVALTLAACGSSGGDAGGPTTLTVTGTDALEFEPETLSAAAGTVTVELTAEGAVEHTFVIEELGDTEVVAAAAGETSSGTVELDAGSYTYYCDVEGHRSAGMEGELTVPDG